MLYLSGGGGGVPCTANTPFTNLGGMFWHSGLFTSLPITGWRIPPPDSKWYAVPGSGYGPSFLALRTGTIQSYRDDRPFHPCYHSHLDGVLFYTGILGEFRPWLSTNVNSSTHYAQATQKPPIELTGERVSSLRGLPAIDRNNEGNNWPGRVFDRHGLQVRLKDYGTPWGNGDVWWNQSELVSGPCNLSYLTASTHPINFGEWFLWNYDFDLVEQPGQLYNFSYPTRITWEVLSPSRLKRTIEIECLSASPYIEPSFKWRSGLGYVYVAVEDVAEIQIHSIMSPDPANIGVVISSHQSRTIWDWSGTGVEKPRVSFEVLTPQSHTTSLLTLAPGSSATVSLDLSPANGYCQAAINRAVAIHQPDVEVLSRNAAVQDIQSVGSNMLENASGIPEMQGLMDPLFDGLNAYESGNIGAATKALASVYLIYKYVYQNSIRDAQSAATSGPDAWARATRARFSNERRRGQSHSLQSVADTVAKCSYYCTYHLRLKEDPFAELWNALERLGLQPTPGQLWDLLPYSFVVDWFSNIGGTLRTIESYYSMKLEYKLRARIQTYKCEWPLSSQTLSKLFGTAVVSGGMPPTYVWYARSLHGDFGSIDPIAASKGNGFGVDQMVQGGALSIQRINIR